MTTQMSDAPYDALQAELAAARAERDAWKATATTVQTLRDSEERDGEQMRAHVARLREALEKIHGWTAKNIAHTMAPADLETFVMFNSSIWNEARAALADTPGEGA